MRKEGITMLFFCRIYLFQVLTDVFSIFVFIIWFWLLISITRDLFRRRDISGWGKAILIIVFDIDTRYRNFSLI